jgi:hypothetical protein
MGSENLSNGSPTVPDRFAGVGPYRQGRRDGALNGEAPEELAARVPGQDPATGSAPLPPLGLDGLREPGYPPAGWLDQGIPSQTMADHPLLRGLLYELPARGAMPPAGWLDRWFEAARSILELLYVQEAKRPR